MSMMKTILAVLLSTTFYATLRYNLFLLDENAERSGA